MMKWLNTRTVKLLIGLSLLVLPILYLVNEGSDLHRLDPRKHEIQNVLTYFALLLFTYFNHTRLVPSLYLMKRYVRYVIVLLMWTLAVAWIPHRIEQGVFLQPPADPTLIGWIGQILWKENLFPENPRPRQNYEPEFRSGPVRAHRPPPRPNHNGPPSQRPEDQTFSPPLSIKLGIIFLLCSLSTLASLAWQTKSRLNQIGNEKLNAELLQLKAQIHPHFLFNTLNSIYALAIRKDERTADTVVKLSEFMRYMISDVHTNLVSLEKEVAYIHNYIDLQRTRLRDSVEITYQQQGDVFGKKIAPLILFTFIENAFKHGVNPDESSEIKIFLIVRDQELRLVVWNRKVPNRSLDKSTGVGLQNAKDRLVLLYPGLHQLQIDNTPTYFSVDLTLTLV